MKSEHVVIIAAAGAVTGMEAHSLGIRTDNRLIDFAIGATIAVASWYFGMDGVSEFGIGFGFGYGFAAVL